MKSSIYLIIALAIFMFFSCQKEHGDLHEVRYEFTSDVPAEYTIVFSTDNETELTETITGTSWTNTVSIRNREGHTVPVVVSMTVFPPATWVNTANQANITLRIFEDGIEEITRNAVITGDDHEAGIQVSTTL